MPIFRGTNSISKIFRGDTEIIKAFRGTDLIFTSDVAAEYELIADVNVTTATTQIDFDNLNITKNDEIEMVYTFVGSSSTTNTDVSIKINDISGNYQRQNYFVSATSTTSSRSQNVSNALISNARSNRKAFGVTNIKITNQNRFVYKTENFTRLGSEGSGIRNNYYFGNNTSSVSSINKISILSSLTNGIVAGSRIQIYKVVS